MAPQILLHGLLYTSKKIPGQYIVKTNIEDVAGQGFSSASARKSALDAAVNRVSSCMETGTEFPTVSLKNLDEVRQYFSEEIPRNCELGLGGSERYEGRGKTPRIIIDFYKIQSKTNYHH